MTETALERDARRAKALCQRYQANYPKGSRLRPAIIWGDFTLEARAIAASDEAAGVDYDTLRKLVGDLSYALGDIHAMVWGEVPSLLDEDSGGSAHLDSRITALIARAQEVLDDKA